MSFAEITATLELSCETFNFGKTPGQEIHGHLLSQTPNLRAHAPKNFVLSSDYSM